MHRVRKRRLPIIAKDLNVKPEACLSWKYHHRRAMIWQVYKGEVGIIRSDNDTEGDQVRPTQGVRHRLIGLEYYGIALIDGLGNKIQSSSWLLK